MISERMVKAINEQITKEFYSGYLYLQMASYFDEISLPGMANWMKIQTQEELAHGMILRNYVTERGGIAVFGAIDKPPMKYKSPLAAFEKVLEHEGVVTASIHNLVAISEEEKDYATRSRLQWFVDEQVEEESNAMDIIGQLKLVKEGNGLFLLDRELGARTFVVPAPLAGAGA